MRILFNYGKAMGVFRVAHREGILWSYGKVSQPLDNKIEIQIAIEQDEILGMIDTIPSQEAAEQFIEQFEPFVVQEPDYEMFNKMLKVGKAKANQVKDNMDILITNLKTKWGID